MKDTVRLTSGTTSRPAAAEATGAVTSAPRKVMALRETTGIAPGRQKRVLAATTGLTMTTTGLTMTTTIDGSILQDTCLHTSRHNLSRRAMISELTREHPLSVTSGSVPTAVGVAVARLRLPTSRRERWIGAARRPVFTTRGSSSRAVRPMLSIRLGPRLMLPVPVTSVLRE